MEDGEDRLQVHPDLGHGSSWTWPIYSTTFMYGMVRTGCIVHRVLGMGGKGSDTIWRQIVGVFRPSLMSTSSVDEICKDEPHR